MNATRSSGHFIQHNKKDRIVTPRSRSTTGISTVGAKEQLPLQASYSRIPRTFDAIEEIDEICQVGVQTSPYSQAKPGCPAEIAKLVTKQIMSSPKVPNYFGLERWTLLEKIGEGAFSDVYRAKDSSTQHDQVAIKVVRKFEITGTQRANILKEVAIMRNLDHPNIVKLIDFSETQQYYYIILELCPGGELLQQILRLTYFSENLARHVITQVAKAIEYLVETTGVAHRDIKPENIFFYPIPFVTTTHPKPQQQDDKKEDEGDFTTGIGAGGIGVIKLGDFGLSKVLWERHTFTPCGTIGYTAPEILNDERYSGSVDMWAMGCVLYILLCGFPPFYDENTHILNEKVARGQYQFLSPWWNDISKSAQHLISHLLTVDPEKRYTVHDLLKHDWIQQTNEETTAADGAPLLLIPHGSVCRTSPQQLKLVDANQAAYEPSKPLILSQESRASECCMELQPPETSQPRDVFDVGHAFHRQQQQQQAGNLVEMEAELGSANRGLLNSPSMHSRQDYRKPQHKQDSNQHKAIVAIAVKNSIGRKSQRPLNLSLDNATLLEKRRQRL